jgi:enoyl-CoA hydratase
MSEELLVKLEQYDYRWELVLNREDKKNALTGPLVCELKDKLQMLLDNPECHAIIIRGAGGVFCAGLDLPSFFGDQKPEWVSEFPKNWQSFHETVYTSEKPIIGALEKYAIAAGAALALACDFLIVGNNAVLHVSEVERGILAPLNIAWLLLKWGTGRTLDLVLGGERQTGTELVNKGIAYAAVSDDRVVEKAREIADRLAGFSPDGIKGNIRAIRAAASKDSLNEVLKKIRSSQEFDKQ